MEHVSNPKEEVTDSPFESVKAVSMSTRLQCTILRHIHHATYYTLKDNHSVVRHASQIKSKQHKLQKIEDSHVTWSEQLILSTPTETNF